jgi:hypothetical protein
MNENIFKTSNEFDFNKMHLKTPVIISKENFFIKYIINGENPIYLQLPKCTIKQGIITSGKQMYCDILITNTNEDILEWINNLEKHSKQCIFNNREKWFDSQLSMDDIESLFISSIKIVKYNNLYTLRTNVPCHLGQCTLKAFNENKSIYDISNIIHEKNTPLQENINIIPILEIKGIKCSSKNFQILYEIKQMMVLNPSTDTIFNDCIISINGEQSIQNMHNYKDLGNNNISVQNTKKNTDPLLNGRSNLNDNNTLSNKSLETLQQTTTTTTNEIMEVEFDLDNFSDDNNNFKLKDKSDMYYDIYNNSFEKVKNNFKKSINIYFNDNNIKSTEKLLKMIFED